MLKKINALVLICFIVLSVMGCSKEGIAPDGLGMKGPSVKPFSVGIILNQPIPGTLNVNSGIVAGAKRAWNDLGIEYKVLNEGDLVDQAESLKYFAENEYELIVAQGSDMVKPISEIADKYPKSRFVILDKVLDKKNVTSLIFNEEHGGFLAGVAAASLSKSGIVGFVGGSQLDEEAARFQSGYLKGIKYINNTEGKNVQSFVYYAGVFADAMLKPDKGKTIALGQYYNGADIIFQTAGKTGDGVYQAAAETKKYVIGNDSQQAGKFPWNSYGFTVKKYDNAIYNVIKEAYEGKLKQGINSYGVNNQGIDFVASQSVPPEVVEKLKSIKGYLANGKIKLEGIKASAELQLEMPMSAGNGGQGTNTSPSNTKASPRNQSSTQNRLPTQNKPPAQTLPPGENEAPARNEVPETPSDNQSPT